MVKALLIFSLFHPINWKDAGNHGNFDFCAGISNLFLDRTES
jgi:hypothetical protein